MFKFILGQPSEAALIGSTFFGRKSLRILNKFQMKYQLNKWKYKGKLYII